MALFKRKVEKVVDTSLAADMADHLCKKAAKHFDLEAARCWTRGLQEQAEAFEEAAAYFKPQMMVVGLDGEMHFREPSIGEPDASH